MGKKSKKSRFNQVVDIDISFSSNSVFNGISPEEALSKLNLSKEKVTELQRIKSTLPSAPQSARLEEDLMRLPDEGPFGLCLTNVSFGATEVQIEEFFKPIVPTRIKMIEEDGRHKGFCFVDFASRNDLAAAFEKNGMSLAGRFVHMRIADNQSDSRRGGFDRSSGFTSSEGWTQRKSRGPGTYEAQPEAPPDGWRRGVARPSMPKPEGPQRWAQPSATAPVAQPPATDIPERPIIKLAPRFKPVDTDNDDAAKSARHASIFGDAKPVDTATKDREIEERMKVARASTTVVPSDSTLASAGEETSVHGTGGGGSGVNPWSQRTHPLQRSEQKNAIQLRQEQPPITTAVQKASIQEALSKPVTTDLVAEVKPQQNAWKKPLTTIGK